MAPEPRLRPAPGEVVTPSPSERILVIDDEPNIRDAIEEFLSLSGYEVDTAPDGAAGLDLLRRGEYDLVLSDLKMPGVTGIAVIQWLSETHPDLPVMVMTGHATVETAVQALRLGACDYLLKPFSLDEIDRTVGNCLEKRRLERRNTELTEMNERLLDIERIKDDLLATVSHEFRTPLTSMKGFLGLLDQLGLDNLRPDQIHAIDAMRESVERLDVMIGNLLTLVESQNGDHPPVLGPARLGEFLDEYFHRQDPRSLQRFCRVEIDDSLAETEVLLDHRRFPLVLSNLLDNAFKFARVPGEANVRLHARREGPNAVLEVHDDGIGITGAMGETIFDRFTQADMTSTREHQGAGLGLAVVREIVAGHRGTVRLVPPVLGGASVQVTLPAFEGGERR
jgi:signal transduction histidine kinase